MTSPPPLSAFKDNIPMPGVPFFSPTHPLSPGSAKDLSPSTPTLFQPLKIRDVTLRNRILVAPMCQYSTAPSGPQIGSLTPYHIATLGHYALKGAALVMIEATGVQPNGRISPNCPGLWSDHQIEGVKAVADFVKSQGAIAAIQLAHAGRKGSTLSTPLSVLHRKASERADASVGGWPDNVVGPTEGMTWDGKPLSDPEGGYYPPRALTIPELKQLSLDWAAAATRAVKAGIQAIEIHAAHGYLLHQFLSPITNRRTDAYGGSFENRTRLLVEVITEVRKVIPSGMPLFLRVSGSEWMEETELALKEIGGSWDVDSTSRLAKLLPGLGVDLLDISSGANHPQQRMSVFNAKDYQTKIAGRIRKEAKETGSKLLIGAVGLIIEAEQAKNIVDDLPNSSSSSSSPSPSAPTTDAQIQEEAQTALKMTDTQQGTKEPMADVVLIGRQFMREPEWVLRVAHQLGVDVAWPLQWMNIKFNTKL